MHLHKCSYKCPKIQDIGAKIPLFVSYLYNTNITRVLFVPNITILNVFQQFGKQDVDFVIF